MITRVPPGTWEILSFPSSKAAGDTAYQLQIDPRLRVRGRGDEQRTQRWYRQAKETKRGEMGGRESQHLIVPLKRGNQPEGPRRGKEVPSHEPLKGNMPGTLRPEPCPRNDDGSRGSRIHEMRNRVRVMCKPGSVGGLGGRPPRSTRPGIPPRWGLETMRRHGAKNADYRGGVTCLYDTQLLGACLHASECGGRSRPGAVRGMPDVPIAPPATGPNTVRHETCMRFLTCFGS